MKTFKKKAYFAGHQKTQHPKGINLKNTSCTVTYDKVKDSDSENEDWDHDPEIEVQDVKDDSDTTLGRVIRKATAPLPVCAPKKAKVSSTVSMPQAEVESQKHESVISSNDEKGEFEKQKLETVSASPDKEIYSKQPEATHALKALETN